MTFRSLVITQSGRMVSQKVFVFNGVTPARGCHTGWDGADRQHFSELHELGRMCQQPSDSQVCLKLREHKAEI